MKTKPKEQSLRLKIKSLRAELDRAQEAYGKKVHELNQAQSREASLQTTCTGLRRVLGSLVLHNGRMVIFRNLTSMAQTPCVRIKPDHTNNFTVLFIDNNDGKPQDADYGWIV